MELPHLIEDGGDVRYHEEGSLLDVLPASIYETIMDYADSQHYIDYLEKQKAADRKVRLLNEEAVFLHNARGVPYYEAAYAYNKVVAAEAEANKLRVDYGKHVKLGRPKQDPFWEMEMRRHLASFQTWHQEPSESVDPPPIDVEVDSVDKSDRPYTGVRSFETPLPPSNVTGYLGEPVIFWK